MRIALVIFHADPARGGAERYTADLAAAVAAKGHDVCILASDFGAVIPGVKFVALDSRGSTRRARYVRFLDSLDAHRETSDDDIVHAMLPVRQCEFYHPHAGLAAQSMESGHLKHRGRVVQAAAKLATQVNRKRRLFAEVERKLLGENPPMVLCLSEQIKKTVRRHYDLPDERMPLLFNGVDLARFHPARDRGGEHRIALMVAQDFARKGLREAIAAVAALGDRRLQLIVAGRDRPQVYKAQAKSLGVEDQIRFLGPVSDPRRLYAGADFLVLPTRYDPCSLVVLEALAMGLPVISTAANGACEIMISGRHGFVLPDPSDVGALTQAMRRMLDVSTREGMRAACLELRPGLSFDAHVDRLLALYDACKSSAQKSTAR